MTLFEVKEKCLFIKSLMSNILAIYPSFVIYIYILYMYV